jgi:hypothetical protein
MTPQEFTTALARSLYWGYLKDTTGTPGKWSELPEEQRKIWRTMARRALRRIEELNAEQQTEMPS